MTLLVVSQCFLPLFLSRHGYAGEIRVLGDGERAALRVGLRERDEKAGEEDTVSTREAAIESVDRVRGGQVSRVQQVQTLRGESASDLKLASGSLNTMDVW